MIKQIKFVAIPVRDYDKSLAFFRDKLGFKVLTDQHFGPGLRWIEMKIGKAESGIALFTPPGQEDRIGKFTSISFETENVEKTYEELSARGVEFVQGPKKESWGTSAIFKDIDGNQFVLGTK